MKKVLIVDDEMLVRVGLKSTMSWEREGFSIVGEAKNGKEAMELFDMYDPDILLTDICMPVMDGLELIQELKSRKKSLKAAILTHYDDFNYAKQAISLGASEYILKSDLSKENLLKVLVKLSTEIDYEKQGKSNQVIAQVLSKDNLKIDEKQALTDEIMNKKYKTNKKLVAKLEESKEVFEHQAFTIVIARLFFDQTDDLEQLANRDNLISSIHTFFKEIIPEKGMKFSFYTKKDFIGYIINVDPEHIPTDDMAYISNIMTRLKKNIAQFLDINMVIGISDFGHSVKELLRLRRQADIALNLSFLILKAYVFILKMRAVSMRRVLR